MEAILTDESDVNPLLRGVLPPSEKEAYLYGCCHIFALALAEMTNLKVAAFVEKRAIFENEEGKLYGIPFVTYNPKTDTRELKQVGEGLIHAFCLLDDKSNMIFDALGIRDIDNLNSEYHLYKGISIQFYDDPNEILKFGHTFGVRDKDVDIYVSKTKDYIKTYLSDDLKLLSN